ncbi:hypothetical protein KC19_2G174500 [Ceratodon purpureus]|uniref:Uncharacterized protein n=1 Tax=Ceratodon purpureus TaxID=3225 RepID=A0A8T0IXE2_CERPU|nr:hypothetical protein KC19_2G174500 [Ceratodon purpureus]
MMCRIIRRFAYHLLWRTTIQWIINRLFDEAYPLLGLMYAGSAANKWSNVPNFHSSKHVQTRLKLVFLAKPYQLHYFTAYLKRVCALCMSGLHLEFGTQYLHRQRCLCFLHTYDIALLMIAPVKYDASSFDTSRSLLH